MSLIMSIYLNDGVVMASDSRTTLVTTKTNGNETTKNIFPFSDLTFKSFIAPNNCGIATCGDSSYNNKPISGFINSFLLTSVNKNTSVFDLANGITDYFSNLDSSKTTIFHVCGYELNANNEYESKLYWCITGQNKQVTLIPTNTQGAKWDGETVTLQKLIKTVIINPQIIDIPQLPITIGNQNILMDSYVLDKNKVTLVEESDIAWNLMTISDALEFIKFAFETTINNMKFQSISKTVGGPIDILVVKPNKTKWIKRKDSF